eukprot:scaffold261_cov336-Pavlova_lutheri.AAC.31
MDKACILLIGRVGRNLTPRSWKMRVRCCQGRTCHTYPHRTSMEDAWCPKECCRRIWGEDRWCGHCPPARAGCDRMRHLKTMS